MKHLAKLLTTALFIVTVAACKKESTNSTQLQGHWKLSENYISTGGPAFWKAANQKTEVTFDGNGSLKGSAFPEFVKYTVKDSVTLSFFDVKNNIQNYRYTLKDGSLTLSPAGPFFCIEGCASRFVKVKDE